MFSLTFWAYKYGLHLFRPFKIFNAPKIAETGTALLHIMARLTLFLQIQSSGSVYPQFFFLSSQSIFYQLYLLSFQLQTGELIKILAPTPLPFVHRPPLSTIVRPTITSHQYLIFYIFLLLNIVILFNYNYNELYITCFFVVVCIINIMYQKRCPLFC